MIGLIIVVAFAVYWVISCSVVWLVIRWARSGKTAETSDTHGEISNDDGNSEHIFGTKAGESFSSYGGDSFDYIYGMDCNDALEGGSGRTF